MSSRDSDDHKYRRKGVSSDFPPLPTWIVRKHLLRDEQVTWVHGPRSSPVEWILTNVLVVVAAAVVAVGLLTIGVGIGGSIAQIPAPLLGIAIFLVLGSIFVIAISTGHYTRLVVTNLRVMILQGNEKVRSWHMDRLPRSLTKYSLSNSPDDPEAGRTVDLDALRSILGKTGDRTSNAKGIMSLGKQVDQMRAR